MHRTLFSAALALSLAACQYNKEGVYLVHLPAADDLICDISISENFSDSDPPDDGTTSPSEYVITEEATTSDALLFAHLFENKSGEVVLQWGTNVYLGTVDGGVITVTWVNENDSEELHEYSEGDYRYEAFDNTTLENTITLTKNKDTKGYAGNWKTALTSTSSWAESDEWDATAPLAPYAGQINGAVFTYLVGSGSNTATQTDCDSNPCEIEVTSICDGSTNFEMVETDLDAEAYEAVEEAGQPAGVF